MSTTSAAAAEVRAGEIAVELIEHMGSDLSIVDAARVSYAKHSDWDYRFSGTGNNSAQRRLKDADVGLVGYLARNRHGTPFEMVQFKFRVHVPIGVAREWQRHRIGSFNEVSTRYTEMKPEFYLPDDEAARGQIGKPGHYEMVTLEADRSLAVRTAMNLAFVQAYKTYQDLVEYGVAKELARNVLPLALFTEFIWSVNLRSLFNFLSLRTHETALLEIRRAALRVEELIRDVVPVAHAAWCAGGRVPL